jgi:hypothetical protein
MAYHTAYSIGAFVVWAAVLAIIRITRREKAGTFRTVCLGWLIGWTLATIARFVYPPPTRWQRKVGTNEEVAPS